MSRLPGLTVKHLLPALVLLVSMSIPMVRSFASDEPLDEDPAIMSEEDPAVTSDTPAGDGPAITIDAPSEVIVVAEDEQLMISGWAGDFVGDGTGIAEIHVYADGPAGAGGIPLGSATYGVPRADVATVTGRPAWENSGFNFAWSPAGLAPGPHTLYFYAYSPARDQWNYSTLGVNVAPRGVATNRYLVNPYVDPLNYNLGYPGYPVYNNYPVNNAQTCSSGYVTATGQCIYSPSSGSCQPGYGYMNGACVPWSGSGACPGGFHQNQTQCVPNSTNVSCPSGYVASFGDCVPDTSSGPSCPPGTIAVSGGCAVSGSNVNCPAGYVFDGVSCVVYNGGGCAPGYAFINGFYQPQGTGIPNTTVNQPAVFCQPGYVYTNGACQPSGVSGQGSTTCPAGYQAVNNQCIYTGTNTNTTTTQCPALYQNVNGNCIYTGTNTTTTTVQCPAGYQNVNGTCIYTGVNTNTTTTQCQAGYLNVSGQCIYTGTGTSTGGQCPAGSFYQNGACYSTGGGQQNCAGAFNPYGVRC